MKQLVLPLDYCGESSYTAGGTIFHHLVHVRRAQVGDRIPGRTAGGDPVGLIVERIDRDSCTLSVLPVAAGVDPRAPEIVLLQCLPKGRKMDLIVRQAAEAGVARVVPVESLRSVRRTAGSGEGDGGGKRERWKRIVREAVQQSGSPVMTEVAEPVPFARIGETVDDEGIGLFFHEGPMQSSGIHVYLSEVPRQIALCIGPEGGLASAEVETLLDLNFRPVRLGANILRTETAALYAVAAVQTVARERRLWNPCEPPTKEVSD